MTVVPAALVFVLFGRPIVYVWSRHEVMPGRLLLIALALWTATNCVGGPLAMFFNGLSVIRFQVICASLMAVMNLALSIVLAHYTGVAGVVLGTVISQTLCIYIPSAFYVPKILKSRLAAAPQPAQ
jgi:O-antigen/teichoic acid export membrane protein